MASFKIFCDPDETDSTNVIINKKENRSVLATVTNTKGNTFLGNKLNIKRPNENNIKPIRLLETSKTYLSKLASNNFESQNLLNSNNLIEPDTKSNKSFKIKLSNKVNEDLDENCNINECLIKNVTISEVNTCSLDENLTVERTHVLDLSCSEVIQSENNLNIFKDLVTNPVNNINLKNTDNHDSKVEGDKELESGGEYFTDIYNYSRQAEVLRKPRADYMRKQRDLSKEMRCVLIDWMVDVIAEFKLSRETLFLAVNYVDRFLSLMSVTRSKFQLLATAAMHIAAKYEEVSCPSVNEFVYFTDQAYTTLQVLKMEKVILQILEFQLSVPTASFFCAKILHEVQAEPTLISLSMYLLELTLLDSDPFLQFVASEVACASIAMARYTLGLDPWSHDLINNTKYIFENFKECFKCIHHSFVSSKSRNENSVNIKYQKECNHKVSLIMVPQLELDEYYYPS